MEQLSGVSSRLISDRDLRRAAVEYRWHAERHARAVNFQLALNAALAAVSVWLMKIEGPYFGDAIAAALFLCGFGISLFSIRVVRASGAELRAAVELRQRIEHHLNAGEGEPEPAVRRRTGITAVLAAFALFHLSAAAGTVWLTYVSPPDAVHNEDDTFARSRGMEP